MMAAAPELQLMTAEQFQQLRTDLAEALHARMEDGHLIWECDHTLKHTEAWLNEHHLNVVDHLDVLPLLSVFCDCEVLGIDHWPPFSDEQLRLLNESNLPK